MAETAPGPRTGAGSSIPDAADDFEFRILPSGGLVPADAGDMCVADELFSHGKLLPLCPSSATAADAPRLALLPRSESVASAAAFGSRYDSRSASSSGSSSGCVSRSHSSKSASSDHAGAAAAPARRSLSSSLFYAHPSPSPRLRTRPRRSTGSAPPPPAAWGIIRLGVVGVPDVYPPRPAEAKNAAAARGGSGRSARFELHASSAADKKHGVGLFGDGLGCKCSPDVVESVSLLEAAKKSRNAGGGVKRGQSIRRSRIMNWLQELSLSKEKK